MDDRRRDRRFQMQLPLEVSAAGQQLAALKTHDLSYRSLYFVLDRDLEPGSPLEFVLTLPKELTLSSEVRVRCTGRVVRVEKVASEKADGADSHRVGVAAMIERYDFLPSPPAESHP